MDKYVEYAVCPVYSVTTHDSAPAGPAAKCGQAAFPPSCKAVQDQFETAKTKITDSHWWWKQSCPKSPSIIPCGACASTTCCLWWLLPNATLPRITHLSYLLYTSCKKKKRTVSSQRCFLVCIDYKANTRRCWRSQIFLIKQTKKTTTRSSFQQEKFYNLLILFF